MARGEGSLSLFLFSLSLAGTHGKSKAASVLESFLGFCSLVNGQRCRGRSQQTENRPAKEAVLVVSTARFFASIRVHLSGLGLVAAGMSPCTKCRWFFFCCILADSYEYNWL
jgi:hypothetical protein